jgi:hypothetical protein
MQRFKLTWVYRPGRTNVADPISRNPAFLATITAVQQASSDVVSAAPTTVDMAATTTLRGVGKSIHSGYALDKDFGDTDFVKRHDLVQGGTIGSANQPRNQESVH